MMEMKNIRTFVRVAELGNFTRAAQELGYAQSTVTMQIQQLEDELRASLFARNGKRVCASSYADLFQDFLVRHPKIQMKLQIVTTHHALDYLDRGLFDLIFLLDNKILRPDLVTAREYPVDISFFCAASHPLAREKKVSLERLLQENFILTEKGCNYRQVFESDLAARDQTLRCVTEIGFSQYIIQAVAKQLGIGLLPSITLADALRAGSIVLIPVENYQIRMSIQVIYSNRRRVSPPLHTFLDAL